jgi:hypothetical protein
MLSFNYKKYLTLIIITFKIIHMIDCDLFTYFDRYLTIAIFAAVQAIVR